MKGHVTASSCLSYDHQNLASVVSLLALKSCSGFEATLFPRRGNARAFASRPSWPPSSSREASTMTLLVDPSDSGTCSSQAPTLVPSAKMKVPTGTAAPSFSAPAARMSGLLCWHRTKRKMTAKKTTTRQRVTTMATSWKATTPMFLSKTSPRARPKTKDPPR